MALMKFIAGIVQLVLIVVVSARYGVWAGALTLCAVIANAVQGAIVLLEKLPDEPLEDENEEDADECGNG